MRELDLHGMKTADALAHFRSTYELIRASAGSAGFKVIHGYGSCGMGGDTRAAIRALLASNPECSEFAPGEDIDGNPGYTIVYPKRRLPSGSEQLWDRVVEFCATPRTQANVVSRFVRKSTEPEIVRALHELESRGRLKTLFRNGRKHYVDPRAKPSRL